MGGGQVRANALQMFFTPKNNNAIIWTQSVRKTLVINPMRFAAFAIRCAVDLVNASKLGSDEGLHVDVDVTEVHTLVRL